MSKKAAIVASIALVTSAGAASCVRLDEAHCIVNGGDFACEDGRMCATEIDAFKEPSDEGDGCVSIEETKDYFATYMVHVEYGLPDEIWPQSEDDVDSLGGLLLRTMEEHTVGEACPVDEDVVWAFEPAWREVGAVRAFLERRSRVRAKAATLESFQVQAITGFNTEINEWLEECRMKEME